MHVDRHLFVQIFGRVVGDFFVKGGQVTIQLDI